MAKSPQFVDDRYSAYLKGQLSGNPNQAKKALQEICRQYRNGYRIHPNKLTAIQNEIMGLIFSSEDLKVRRWTLNALAQLGSEINCKNAVMYALKNYSNDPDVLAASLAALYRLSPKASQDIRDLGFDEKMVTLAALQHVPAQELNLSSLPVNVERASDDLIKLGLVLVGVDKATPHMFDPDYANAEIVRVLGRDRGPIITQYSVWAITENPNLSVTDLGVDLLKNVEQQEPNVRGWVFQLLASDRGTIEKYLDYIKCGIEDKSAEARLGLAVGLRSTFSPKLERLALEWFTREMDQDVRQQLVDHLIRHSDQSADYNEHAIAEFERAESNARERMLATASGTLMFSKLARIEHNGSSDLFRGPTIMNTKTINIHGNVQGGAVAFDGDATNAGTNAVYNIQTLSVLQGHLIEAENEVKAIVADIGAKKEALETIAVAKASPTKDNLTKVVTGMERLAASAEKLGGVITTVARIGQLIAQAAGIS